MKDLLDWQNAAVHWWFEQTQSNLHAWTTIALRMPDLAIETLNGRPPSRETKRMVQEKIAATMEGAFAGSLASMKLAEKAMHARLNGPKLAVGLIDVANAASAPARHRVRANARRLTRKSIRNKDS